MNKCISLIIASTAFTALAQVESLQHAWTATLKITDDDGKPVTNAKATVYYMLTNSIVGLTDTNGVFVASHRDQSVDLAFQIEKSGYYMTRVDYHLGFYYKPDKWNPIEPIVLRKIGTPIPMYAKKQEMRFPKLDEPVGFDLMAGDWVTPYGKGFHTDMLFKAHRKIISDREFTADLTVTFPNTGDGVVIAPQEPVVGSEFKTPRTVTRNGYKPELDLHYSNSERPKSVFGYFIRVRTVLDDGGNIKSALYGKIRGDLRFYAGTIAPTAGMGFDYYLNPKPNDRNVEFDPKQNLLKGLKPIEQVTEP